MNYMLESHDTTISTVTDLFGNEYTPDPQQTIQYVSGLMLGNPYFMEKFIREMKRRGGLQDLMTEMFQHGDSYEIMVDHLEDGEFGPSRAGKLARMMNDRYMKVFDNLDFGNKDEDDDDLGESVAPSLDAIMGQPTKKPAQQGGAFGGGSGPDGTPDPTYAQSGVFGSSDSNPMGAAGAGRGPKSNALGGMTRPQFGQQPLMPPMTKKMKEGGDPKYTGNRAGLHLINELSGYPAFKRHMIDRCSGPDC